MKRQIELNIIRRVPVFTVAEISENHIKDLRKDRHALIPQRAEYGLPPFFFAQTKKKALVFTSPYKSLVEKLEVIGETKKLFKNIPVEYDKDGLPILHGVHYIPEKSKAPSPQLLLRFAE